MNLDEAIAIYLYLQHAKRGPEEEKDFKHAWGIICEEAGKATIRRIYQS